MTFLFIYDDLLLHYRWLKNFQQPPTFHNANYRPALPNPQTQDKWKSRNSKRKSHDQCTTVGYFGSFPTSHVEK